MFIRLAYIFGSLLAAACVVAVVTLLVEQPGPEHPGGHSTVPVDPSDAGVWFRQMKPFCNAVEVETAHQTSPPPATEKGTGYSAACYALAGKIDRARELILTVPSETQWKAAGVVFNVAHPVADAGDDESAGPIMELVIEFWPNHYMALYHAGMSQYILGNHAQARAHLEDFLSYYQQDDGWRSNAITILDRMKGG